jgi:hypothetical protein
VALPVLASGAIHSLRDLDIAVHQQSTVIGRE